MYTSLKLLYKKRRDQAKSSHTSSAVYSKQSNLHQRDMDGQSSICMFKTLLIASVVYVLTAGAPVERDTTNTCNMIKKGERPLSAISSVCSNTPPICLGMSDININDTDDYLKPVLQNGAFTRAVGEAVDLCINTTGYAPEKCKLATAALTLQATIISFIAEYNGIGSELEQWLESSPRVDADMEQILCWAETYTMAIWECTSRCEC